MMRGKNHGALDVSLAVMSVNKKSRRIDLDAGDNLLHLRVRSCVWSVSKRTCMRRACFISVVVFSPSLQAKNHEIFYIWMTKLTVHRVYKKNEAMSIHHGVLQALSAGSDNTLPAMASLAQRNRAMMDTVRGRHTLIPLNITLQLHDVFPDARCGLIFLKS